jgi:Ca-activated chloride channel family protein
MQRLILLFTIFISLNLTAQQGVTFDLTVNDGPGGKGSNRDVVFVESSTFERKVYKTDANGKLSVTFSSGKLWLGSVGEMRNCIRLKTVMSGSSSQSMNYDPEGWERENKVLPDRRSIAFKEITQKSFSPSANFSENESLITIALRGRSGQPHPSIEVSLVCFATEIKYTGVTNRAGEMTFKIPNNSSYEIDVDGIKSLRYIDLDDRSMIQTVGMMFEPKKFTEKKDKRFIVQDLPDGIMPSSSHARVKLDIASSGITAVDEEVHMRMLKSNKVYKAKTNDQGQATFMLPINNKYMVDLEFQRDADVIDLSYIKGIGYLNQGINYIPDPRLQNIEDFIPSVAELIEYDINDFVDRQYPEPESGDVDFYLNWGNKFNENSKEALLEVGLKVKSKMTRKSADPLNICIVVDKSGSMSGEDRIGQLKKSLANFIEQLKPTDIVSIVVFEGTAAVAVPAQKIGDKKSILDIVYAIGAGGGTNIHEGLLKGYDEVKKLKTANTINRLILLTDGFGSTPVETIVSEAKEFVNGGFELSAVGVGASYNKQLLSQLASAGGGLLHLAGTSHNIQEAFQRELESIIYPMAKKAKLTVRYNDKIVYRQLYGYANEVVTPGKMSVEIENLFPGLDRLALIKFDLINATRQLEREKVDVELEYIDAVTNKSVVKRKSIRPEWTDATGELDLSIDKEHKKALAVAVANQSLKVMANTFEAGDRRAAEAAVASASQQFSNLFPKATPQQLIYVNDRLLEYVQVFEQLRTSGF